MCFLCLPDKPAFCRHEHKLTPLRQRKMLRFLIVAKYNNITGKILIPASYKLCLHRMEESHSHPTTGESPTHSITARLLRNLPAGLGEGLKDLLGEGPTSPSSPGLEENGSANAPWYCTALPEKIKIKVKKAPRGGEPLTDDEVVTFPQNVLQRRISYLKGPLLTATCLLGD